MSTQHRTWGVIAIMGLIVVATGCASPTATPTASPTATQTVTQLAQATPTTGSIAVGSTGNNNSGTGGSNGGTGGNNGSTGSNNGGTGGNDGGTGGSNGGSGSAGPYVVKQIESLGGEVISGGVCSLTQPFNVTSTTPHVTFIFYFAPQDAQKGKVTYAYSIPSAGESHDAAGTYSLSPLGTDGTLQLSLSVSDHVAFKGFDGNIPNKYKFNLVPSATLSCSPAP